MMSVLFFTVIISVTAAVYFFITSFILISDRKTRKVLKKIRQSKALNLETGRISGTGRRGLLEDASTKIFRVLPLLIAKLIRLSPRKRDRMAKKMKRAGMRMTVEEFYANAVISAMGIFILIPLLILLNIKVAALACGVLGICVYYQNINQLEQKIKMVTIEITNELPRFVSVISYSMSADRDLIRTIEKYLRICKSAFRYDLELLLLEMKSGNMSEALKRFDERIDIPQLSVFVSGLIDADRGIDQKTFFYIMEENMKQLFVENKKKELSKRPEKIKRAIVAVGVCLFILYIVPISIQLGEGLKMFE